jgi:hypothetical protein
MAAGRFINKTATILAGQSLSSVLDCTSGGPAFIHMPLDWTSAMLSFQVSPDGVNFNDLFDRTAAELAINILGGTSLNLDQTVWKPVLYLKMRSGVRNNPISQVADRVINVTIDTS